MVLCATAVILAQLMPVLTVGLDAMLKARFHAASALVYVCRAGRSKCAPPRRLPAGLCHPQYVYFFAPGAVTWPAPSIRLQHEPFNRLLSNHYPPFRILEYLFHPLIFAHVTTCALPPAPPRSDPALLPVEGGTFEWKHCTAKSVQTIQFHSTKLYKYIHPSNPLYLHPLLLLSTRQRFAPDSHSPPSPLHSAIAASSFAMPAFDAP